MPFYKTEEPGDNAVFPKRYHQVREKGKSRKHEYIPMDKKELIALCDEREILSLKGTPIGRNQKKAYYIERLLEHDVLYPAIDES